MYQIYPVVEDCMSELIDIKKILEDYQGVAIHGSVPFKQCNEKNERMHDIKRLMNVDISLAEFKELSTYCNPEELLAKSTHSASFNITDSPFFSPRSLYIPEKITPESLHLKTIAKLKKRIDDGIDINKSLKYRNIIPGNELKASTNQPDLVPGKEVLISIRLYQPFQYKVGSTLPIRFSHEVVVLGSHTLDVLRDKIFCTNDFICLNDLSEKPDLDDAVFIKDKYKSGFLFIEDTFYNDTRHPSNIDYSECIRSWAINKPEIELLKTEIMENTTFNSLKVHLGYPQVYQHAGKCEHIFVFSDIEILQPSDVCYSSKYPFYKTIGKNRAQYCYMCGLYVAKWLVNDCDRVPFNPAFFCDNCLRSYNYIGGKKVGNFKLYPYCHKGLLISN